MFDFILFDCVCDGFYFGEAFYYFDADTGEVFRDFECLY